jgi:ABC-type transport system substrate-binding protein
MKIIQIIKDGNKLLGLGDNGITYVYSKIKYSVWNEKLQEEQSRYAKIWREVAVQAYEGDDAMYYMNPSTKEFDVLEEYYDKVISDEFNYENDIH